MINPWTIIVALALAAALLFGGEAVGHKHGVDTQKVADQAQFDSINAQLSKQKADAAQKYRDDQAAIIAAQHDHEVLQANLEKEHVKNQDTTNRLHDAYAAYSLRFSTPENSGCGDSAGCAESPQGSAASVKGSEVVQLPEAIARNLRQLAFDADQLNDDYTLCYGYETGLNAPGVSPPSADAK